MMKVLFEKLNRANSEKRLKKEARLLYRSADAIYRHEMSKPRDERDKALMDECLLTIKQSSEILTGGKVSKAHKFMPVIRVAAASLAVLIALLAVTTGVTYAKGFNLWKFLFSSNENRVTIVGNITSGDTVESGIDFDAVPNTNEDECASFDEAIKKLGINPINLDLTNRGMMVDNIYIVKNDAVMEINMCFTCDESYVYYTVSVFRDGDTAFVTDILGEYSILYTENINGMEINIGEGEYENALCWTDGLYVYQVYTNMDTDIIISSIEDGKS